jgi:hypothetical protein
MGKRSDFPRRPHDDYDSPPETVLPLLPHLNGARRFAEPCAGRGMLVRALEAHGLQCVFAAELRIGINPPATRIAEGIDVLSCGKHVFHGADVIITNPPWTRQLMHPIIGHCCAILPTWALFDADWAHNVSAGQLVSHCVKIVSVGRVRWIAGSESAGKDNAAWYLFDVRHKAGPQFVGRGIEEAAA